ncbi:hypothetical protein TEA_021128 [Camellia sinensis var. sinensis]|uniref:Uncharacterized protein n=1 Tax=Camellia sinensis var. sinensis TaxID=542762 RepID=A0A4S4DRG5_CAMSN|nr:hypothetical protein TEA_021128 [Camellia sinensis var. sinensis]
MEESVEKIQLVKHRVDQFRALMFLETGNEAYHHVGVDWWRNEAMLLIQPWRKTDAHNVNHIVLVKPSSTLEDSLKTAKLCCDPIKEWIEKNPTASICTTEGSMAFKDIANFQDYHGLPEYRNVRLLDPYVFCV